MGKTCQLAAEDFVAAVLQLVVQCDVEEYELKAIRKISRKQTRMIRRAKDDRENRMNREGDASPQKRR
jgi:hypothetical protein